MIDWIAVGTVGAVVVSIVLYVLQRLRTTDEEGHKRFDTRLDQIYSEVQLKLDKTEHQISLLRIDRDIDRVRQDQIAGFAKLEAKLDKIIDWTVENK